MIFLFIFAYITKEAFTFNESTSTLIVFHTFFYDPDLTDISSFKENLSQTTHLIIRDYETIANNLFEGQNSIKN